MITPEIQIFAATAALQQAAAEQIAAVAEASIAAKGSCTLVLAGGSTPQGAYHLLTKEPLLSRIDWPNMYLLMGDERYVPADHDDSNMLAARLALINHVSIPADQVFPVPTYYHNPAEAAAIYARQVEALLAAAGGLFDLVLLGIGPDGHTASLFPENAALDSDPVALAVAVDGAPKPPPRRISLTAQALNRSERTIFLASGADKAPAVRAIVRGEVAPRAMPARMIAPAGGKLTWMLDSAAAAQLG
jgi:6-phosphogluconolactonase